MSLQHEACHNTYRSYCDFYFGVTFSVVRHCCYHFCRSSHWFWHHQEHEASRCFHVIYLVRIDQSKARYCSHFAIVYRDLLSNSEVQAMRSSSYAHDTSSGHGCYYLKVYRLPGCMCRLIHHSAVVWAVLLVYNPCTYL